ncbi:MAG: cell division protein FtsX [Rhodospirillales bacterium]
MRYWRPLPMPEIDLPLAHDASGRFLPRIIAFMSWLAALALIALVALAQAGADWRQSLAGTLTVEVMPAAENEPAEAIDRRVETAVALVRDFPGVVRAEPLAEARTATLLEPWLGSEGLGHDIRLPRLIDVIVAPDGSLDAAGLAERLAAAVPGARLDDHQGWLKRLLDVIRVVEIAALAVIGLITAAAISTVVFTTRTGLTIHRDEIELLHLLGATDSYIARQFARQAGVNALLGALAGVVLAAATAYGIAWLAGAADLARLPDLAHGAGAAAALAGLPAAAIALTAATAWATVIRSLARVL